VHAKTRASATVMTERLLKVGPAARSCLCSRAPLQRQESGRAPGPLAPGAADDPGCPTATFHATGIVKGCHRVTGRAGPQKSRGRQLHRVPLERIGSHQTAPVFTGNPDS
jgi:hypothetical protein